MKRSLRILLIEDSDDDEALVRLRLQNAGYELVMERVETADAMARALLENPERDLILSDYSLPTFSAPLALTVLQQSGLDIPFIIISGTIGEERAVSTMRAGARDFILKSDLTRLIPVLEREMRETEARKLKRKVDQAYRSSERRYRMIVDNAKEGIWLLDAEGKSTFANKYLAQMLGHHEQEILGHHFSQFMEEEDRKDAVLFFERRKQGVGEQADFKLRTQDGQVLEATLSATAMNDETQGFQGALVMVTDVTERKKTEQDRLKLLQELQAAVMVRDEFVSVASHELKTPLTSLKLQVQMRQRYLAKRKTEAFAWDSLERMFSDDNRQLERLTRLVDDMLDVSRINAGKLTLQPERFDLGELVHEVVVRFASQLSAAGCEVRISRCDRALGCWDRYRIEQVITNLLTNAIKYGARKPVEISIEAKPRQIELRVRDHGRGIAREDHERIFRKFERAISCNEVSGLGLGLSIVTEILRLHGGSVRVESELKEGSTFIVELPQVDHGAPSIGTVS